MRFWIVFGCVETRERVVKAVCLVADVHTPRAPIDERERARVDVVRFGLRERHCLAKRRRVVLRLPLLALPLIARRAMTVAVGERNLARRTDAALFSLFACQLRTLVVPLSVASVRNTDVSTRPARIGVYAAVTTPPPAPSREAEASRVLEVPIGRLSPKAPSGP